MRNLTKAQSRVVRLVAESVYMPPCGEVPGESSYYPDGQDRVIACRLVNGGVLRYLEDRGSVYGLALTDLGVSIYRAECGGAV